MVNKKQNEPIVVFGGTGHYGRHIVRSLLEMGEPVRVLSRNADSARKILGDDSEVIEGDITDRESVVESLKGVKGIVISVSAFSWGTIRQLKLVERDSVLMVLEEAKKMGIKRIVYISVYEIRMDLLEKLKIKMGNALYKLEVEKTLKKSDFNWTILGAPPSMEMFFSFIRGNTMMVPGGGPPAMPTISPLDVGKIAAQAVLRKDLSGKRFQMTGPQAFSFPQAAKVISEVTGKDIKFRKIPLLPLKIASIILWPLNPFLRHLVEFIKLLNNFPQEFADKVPETHKKLMDTFQYAPETLEMKAQRWRKSWS